MKKQTKVLLAAAALTLGASFTAMAAEATYDWKMEDGQWVCYDEDGDTYDNEWVKSAGKDYYVGDDGVMVTNEWIEGFYLDSTGAKTMNAWKFILADGEDADDDEAEENWYYFGSKGAITKGKKVIGGETYYFTNEGEMITGWVDVDANKAATTDSASVVYTDENGARTSNMWLKSVAPGVDEEEEDEPDYFWYYIGSNGAPKTGRQLDINGETYFFNEAGQMLSGWVTTTTVGEKTVYTNANAALSTYGDVYFCGDEDQGWAKKSTWINEYRNTVGTADVDVDDMYWFWVDSKGKVLKAATNTAPNAAEKEFDSVNNNGEVVYADRNNNTTHGKTKEINGKDYIFNQNGEMLSGLVYFYGNTFYYGDAEDGSMKIGEIVLEDVAEEEEHNFFFAKTKKYGYGTEGAAVTGNAAGKLYNNGMLVTFSTGNDYREHKVGGYEYVVDKNGNIKTSTKEYKKLNDDDKKVTYLNTSDYKFYKEDGVKEGHIVSKTK
ncbi:MAG: hypothetical protein IKU39_03645 [Lachnospiraceae bacterium]|nr:hypothetical protein [Lachnospiraceae bacterium]